MTRLHGSDEESDRLRSLRRRVVSFKRGRTDNDETFAQKYVRYLDRHGYQLPSVPELEPIVRSSHWVRVFADGYAFNVIAVIDRDREPDARHQLHPDTVQAIGRECARYTGSVGSSKLPVLIELLEVGTGIATPEDKARLGTYAISGVQAWLLDTGDASAWSSTWAARAFFRWKYERLLRKPNLDHERMEPVGEFLPAQASSIPFFSIALGLILVGVFAAEAWLSRSGGFPSGPSLPVLVQLGALSRTSVLSSGELWRLLTAPFLHLSMDHLVYNLAALAVIGLALEFAIGRLWCATIFAAGALGGAIVSVMLLPQAVFSAGASGGILALYAASFILLRRLIRTEVGTGLLLATLAGLIPALVPLGSVFGRGPQIDYAAHAGGLIAGVAVGMVILRSWSPRRSQPPAQLPLTLPVAGGLLLALGAVVWRIMLGWS